MDKKSRIFFLILALAALTSLGVLFYKDVVLQDYPVIGGGQGALCDLPGSQYLLVSEQVPPVVYYSHIPGMLIALFAGLFVFIKNRASLASSILLFILANFSLWVFLDTVFWATNRSDIIMFAWGAIILIEPLVYLGAVYLVHVMLSGADMIWRKKLLLAGLALPLILLVPTAYNLSGFDLATCLSVEGPLALYYTYAVEIFAALWILRFAFGEYHRSTVVRRKEIFVLTTGLLLFLLAFSFGNIVGSFTEDWELAQYGLFGMPIFAGFLAYLIVTFGTFNIKLLAAEALVWGLWVLIGSEFFFVTSPINIALVATSFALAIIFGIFLVRSVRIEVAQREKLEELTKELASANDRLKELDRLKSEFLSFASHQVKSPLGIIKGYAGLLLEGAYGKVPKKALDTVSKIKASADRLIDLVNDLLNVRKLEEGRVEYSFAKASLTECVREISEELRHAAEEKGLRLVIALPKEKLIAKLDSQKFRQIIQNFIDNAIKYTNDGTVTVSLTEENDAAVVSVTDTGMGIERELIKELFRQFRRDKNVARHIQGTGLGLYIAKEFAKAHGGDVWATSPGPGKGATFFVRIPLA